MMHRRRPSNPVFPMSSTQINSAFYHHELEDDSLPQAWYRNGYEKLAKLSHALKDVQRIGGRIANIKDGSLVTNDRIISQMQAFDSLSRDFIGSPSMQQSLQRKLDSALKPGSSNARFSRPSERSSLTLDSLTKVCDFLRVSAQRRSTVRLTICPQVTQHHIWQGALEEVIGNLKSEMDTFKIRSEPFTMGQQIISNCFHLFADIKELSNSESSSWMHPTHLKRADQPPMPPRKWEQVLEMFVDLSTCLAHEERLACHVRKLQVMREGLSQIKDILVERGMSYKETRRQDSLVQKKLSKNLGHSSKCLFTLLLYYLYGSVTDIEVEVCGGVYGTSGFFCACIGSVLTCSDEVMVWNAVRQLNRALGVFKFVWETAAMDGRLELQGHVWCVGAEERTLTYRGNVFFVHEIRL